MRYISLVLLATLPLAAEEGKRFALVIGNDAYIMSPLRNAVNDARAVDKALQSVGFKTTLVEDASKAVMEDEIAKLMDRLGPDDTALFYYSGHAVQIEEENVLIPVDMNRARSITEAKIKSFSLNSLFEELNKSKAKHRIVILDSCRSNPITEDRGLRSGLAIPLKAGRGSYIVYSTAPGAVAFDNPDGKNSWFSEALAELIPTPNATIDDVLTKVMSRVEKASGGKQTPWKSGNLTSRFSFATGSEEESDSDPSVVEKRISEAIAFRNNGDVEEAREAFGALAKNPAAAGFKQLIRESIQYLELRRQADQSWESADYALAGSSYQRAYEQDRSISENAIRAVNGYLLADKAGEAARVLKDVRIWGESASIDGINRMLKELAAISPEAADEAKKPNPEPPPYDSVAKLRPAPPSLAEAERYLAKTAQTPLVFAELPEDILAANKAAKDRLEQASAKPPEPATPAEAPATPVETPAVVSEAAAQTDPAMIRDMVELVSLTATRDLRLVEGKEAPVSTSGVMRPGGTPLVVRTKPSGAQLSVQGDGDQKCLSPCYLSLPPGRRVIHAKLAGYADVGKPINMNKSMTEETIDLIQLIGTVLIRTKDTVPIVLDRNVTGKNTSSPLKIPAGEYELRVVQNGKVIRTEKVQVKDGATSELTLN